MVIGPATGWAVVFDTLMSNEQGTFSLHAATVPTFSMVTGPIWTLPPPPPSATGSVGSVTTSGSSGRPGSVRPPPVRPPPPPVNGGARAAGKLRETGAGVPGARVQHRNAARVAARLGIVKVGVPRDDGAFRRRHVGRAHDARDVELQSVHRLVRSERIGGRNKRSTARRGVERPVGINFVLQCHAARACSRLACLADRVLLGRKRPQPRRRGDVRALGRKTQDVRGPCRGEGRIVSRALHVAALRNDQVSVAVERNRGDGECRFGLDGHLEMRIRLECAVGLEPDRPDLRPLGD